MKSMVLLGVLVAFGSMINAVLIMSGAITFNIFMIISILLGVVGGMLLMFVSFMTDGILAPFLKARLKKQDIIAVVNDSGKIDILSADNKGGIYDTKVGNFITSPGTIYMWPNGVHGGIAYYKYGATLPTKYVRATTKFKERGITDIEKLEELDERCKKENKELVTRV